VEWTDPRTGEKECKLGPGLHFAWPFLVDEVVRFPVRRNLDMAVTSFLPPPPPAGGQLPPSLRPGEGGYNLTGDVNIVHTDLVINYSVTDPVKFYERLGDPAQLKEEETSPTIRKLLTHLAESVVIRAMSRLPADKALRGEERARLPGNVRDAMAARLRDLDVGIEINKVTLKAFSPVQTQKAFDEVSTATQEVGKKRIAAESYKNQELAKARGDADRIVNQALASKTRAVADAEANASYMNDLLKQYPNDRRMLSHFLRQRLSEVLGEVLDDAEEVYLISNTGEVRLWLARDPEAVREIIRRRMQREKERQKEREEGTR
jgi:regulator of protease activity HflC (stomatin/prohibitin superfamily)